MPLGPYRDFDDCVAKNRDKANPEAYCGALERDINPDGDKAGASVPRVKFQIVPVEDSDTAAEFADPLEEVIRDVVRDVIEGDDNGDDYPDEMPADDFHALLVVEGLWTGDGRYIDEGALSWRNLPLPLMATDETTEGHMEARLVGNFTRIERIGREIHGWGSFVNSEADKVRDLQGLIARNELRGISVDLDSLEYEVLFPTEQAEPTVDADGNAVVTVEETRMRITAARIMGATVVPFPAFQEAFIESPAALVASLAVETTTTGYFEAFQTYGDIDFVPPQGAQEEAARGLEWRREHGRGGTAVGVARARDIANGRSLSPDTVKRMVSYFARHEVDKKAAGWNPGESGYPSAGRIAWALWGGDPGRAWADKVKRQMESRDAGGSIVASGHPIQPPVVPPSSWFADPQLSQPTPLTVTDEGRIFGHLATWGQCHVGHSNACITPPSSATNYAHFLTGEMLCDDNSRVPVGQITINGPHASHDLNARQTAAHYDNTCTAAADVTAGEDAHGIWVAGALRPDLEPSTVRALMASDVSGDWRRVGGNLELIAVLAVNVPGFPKVRVKESLGLVASLSLAAYDGACTDTTDGTSEADEIAARIGRSRAQRVAELRAKVHAETIAALAARVRGN